MDPQELNADLVGTHDTLAADQPPYPVADLRQCVLAVCVIEDIDLMPLETGVLVDTFRPDGSEGVLLSWAVPKGHVENEADRRILAKAKAVLDDYRDTRLYLDRSQFAPVPVSSITTATLRPGNANPGLIRGPGYWSVNLSVTKGFRLSQTVRLDVRMDAFNAFNRINYANPNTNITSPDFGRILTSTSALSGGPRTAQLGARLSF